MTLTSVQQSEYLKMLSLYFSSYFNIRCQIKPQKPQHNPEDRVALTVSAKLATFTSGLCDMCVNHCRTRWPRRLHAVLSRHVWIIVTRCITICRKQISPNFSQCRTLWRVSLFGNENMITYYTVTERTTLQATCQASQYIQDSYTDTQAPAASPTGLSLRPHPTNMFLQENFALLIKVSFVSTELIKLHHQLHSDILPLKFGTVCLRTFGTFHLSHCFDVNLKLTCSLSPWTPR